MFAKTVLTDDERAVDPHLGYPRGYAKLCRHAHSQIPGLISPFTLGPPQCFRPYAPTDDEVPKLKGYDDLFPILAEELRDTTNPRMHLDFLWQQLDHMENAGFNPDIFRIDVYGNVLYRGADPGSPLSWEADYWFPHPRGGKAVGSNLRLVQWQASQRKAKKLEFLVPWWDLQLGVSVNQFLSVFASKNTNFRHRAFSFFFSASGNEQFNGERVVLSHSWPHKFRDRKNQVGLAAAALVQVPRNCDGTLNALHNKPAKQGNCEEAVRRDLLNCESGSCAGIRDKTWRNGDWKLNNKENKGLTMDRYFTQQEWKQSIEEDRKQKIEESVQLEEELQKMKAQNVREKATLDQLEQALAKQKKRVEKQRRWSETQSQYRLCLEKMIRDTLHQCVVYKEQARLNQAACNALLARLELQKSTCDAAEMDLVRKVRQREELEALARPKITKRVRHHVHTDVGSCLKPNVAVEFNPTSNGPLKVTPPCEEEENRKLDELSSTVQLCTQQANGTEEKEEKSVFCMQKPRLIHSNSKLVLREKYSPKDCAGQLQALELHIHDEEYKKVSVEKMGNEPLEQQTETGCEMYKIRGGFPAIKRKALEVSGELDVVLLGYEYQEHEDDRAESVGDNGSTQSSNQNHHSDNDGSAFHKSGHCNNDDESNNVENGFQENSETPEVGNMSEEICGLVKAKDAELLFALPEGTGGVVKDDEQLDELLQEVLSMQDKVNEAMVEAICDEQDEDRVKRMGKLNLDKWLQKLLLDSGYGLNEEPKSLVSLPDNPNCGNIDAEKEIHGCPTAQNASSELGEAIKGGVIGGLWKKLSFKNNTSPCLEESEDSKLGVCERKGVLEEAKKPEERRVSPWRWASPASRRSSSAGRESCTRRLSPWRRNSKDEKVEERKMMESFSKLKLGVDKQQTEEVEDIKEGLRRHSMMATSLIPQSHSIHRAQTPPPAQERPERSTSTPAPQQRGRRGVSPLASRDAVATKRHPITTQVQRRRERGSMGSEVTEGVKYAMPNASNGGAARKASMLKSASTRGGEDGKAGELGMERGGSGGGDGHAMNNEVSKASLFEDLEAQESLRASISLAWKKAVKKFELGRPPAAHLEL